jgi:hypothetical protein
MIRRLNVFVSDAAVKPVRYKPTFYFVPDPRKTRVELLSLLILFHGYLVT